MTPLRLQITSQNQNINNFFLKCIKSTLIRRLTANWKIKTNKQDSFVLWGLCLFACLLECLGVFLFVSLLVCLGFYLFAYLLKPGGLVEYYQDFKEEQKTEIPAP